MYYVLRRYYAQDCASALLMKPAPKARSGITKTACATISLVTPVNYETLPSEPFIGHFSGRSEAVDWAVQWLPEGGEPLAESYVNLIPTAQGGTHVNGLRSGLLDAMREFCEFRSLIPRGVKLAPDDIWEKCSYVLSSKLADPQFSGQTKERLSSREASAFVAGVAKDAFSLWLNQHTEDAEKLA